MQSKGRLGIRCFNSVEIVFNNFDKPIHKLSYSLLGAEVGWRKLQESSYLLMVLNAHPLDIYNTRIFFSTILINQVIR